MSSLLDAVPHHDGALFTGAAVAIGVECGSLFGTNLDIGTGIIQQLDDTHLLVEGVTHCNKEWVVGITSSNGMSYTVRFQVPAEHRPLNINILGAVCFPIRESSPQRLVYEGLDLNSGLPIGIVQSGTEDCITDEAKILFNIPNDDDFGVTTLYILNREHYK